MREREREREDLVCQIHKYGYKKDWIIVDIFYSLRGVGEGDLDLLGGGGGGRTALIDKTINICKRKGPRFGPKLTVEKSLLKKAMWLMVFSFLSKRFYLWQSGKWNIGDWVPGLWSPPNFLRRLSWQGNDISNN